jgi:hypothetical protein
MLAIRLIAMCLFGYLGYREASKFERDNGRRAYGVPAWGWAAITAVSMIIGAVLLYLARRSAARASGPGVASTAPSHPAPFGWSAPDAPAPREDIWVAPTQPGTQPAEQLTPWLTSASRNILPGR